MENPRFAPPKIDVLAVPKSIGSARVKERAAAMTLLGHHVGVGRRRLAGRPKVLDVDLMVAAIPENLPAQVILTDQTGAEEWEGCPGLCQIDEHVIGRAP